MKRKRSVITIAMAAIMLVSLCAVCTSTSAASSSSASVKASPNLVGNPIPANTAPSECIPKDYRYIYLFVQGYDGALWYNREDLSNLGGPNWGWSGWTSLGGQMTSSPCAVSRQTGIIDVFARGTDGALWQRTTANGGTSWSGWDQIGGQVAPGTGPAASGWSGHEDVFIQATDGTLWQKTWAASSGWSGWRSLGGQLTSSPGAVSRQAGITDVYVRGSDGALWQRTTANGGASWSGWNYIGGQIAAGTGPALSAWQYYQGSSFVNREDVFVKGTDGALWQKTWAASSGWSGWRSLGGKLASSPTVAPEQYTLEVYVRGTDGYLYLDEYYSGVWHGWRGGTMQGPPGAL
jgi:hypothetical protein